jgi:hypothetical protein
MLRRLLSKIRNRVLPQPQPIDLSMLDARIDARIEAQIGARVRERLDAEIDQHVETMLRTATGDGHPNVNALWRALKDMESLSLDVKLLGYQLGLAHEYRLQAIAVEAPGPFMSDCRPVTQGDIETRWFRYWCEQLKERPRYHRKLWEFAYIMQALHAAGALKPGAKVLVLGGDYQPAPSYLAAKGAEVVVAQHTDEALPGPAGDSLYFDNLASQKVFDKLVTRRVVDLSALPSDLKDFDACVCIAAANRRGSISAGLDFMRGLTERVKPGGLAVCIADFNYSDDAQTLDNWGSVLFQRRHFEEVAAAWKAEGQEVTPLDFNVGYMALDRFIDIPPFDVSRTQAQVGLWRDGWQAAHLKTAVDGFAVTSFGMVVRRKRH